ncbi:hypothetical protein [Streptomyces sp. NPDC056227]|uniref:hypothetical protein n=1 Tax=Streptomyces sp. NPDC056227 TaxID=3345753 RepID=UPI0035E1DE06
MNLEAERARYNKLCRAAARNDWTEILIAFTKGPGNGNETTVGRRIQPLRDALEARRTDLRQQQAARIGCTCD